jgi:ribosomal protein S18 acetylase RimI-like enzyme
MVSIRKATPSDYKTISRFQEKMAMETENLLLDPETVQAGVKAVFSDPSKGSYYIAESQDTVAGCLLTTFEWSDWRNGWILWIQSVYVSPEYRKQGIYKMLYMHVKQLVEDFPDLKGIRLYVDKTNEGANSVYRRCGMDGEHYRLFEWLKTSQGSR